MYIPIGQNPNTHVHLRAGPVIIDDTYRQFLYDNRGIGDSEYCHYLFEKLPPYFVGTEDHFEQTLQILHNLNKKVFGHALIVPDKILEMWSLNYAYKMHVSL